MVLCFDKKLEEALGRIGFNGEYQELVVFKEERKIGINDSEIISQFGEMKGKVVERVNEKFSCVLKDKFDLYNWLERKDDELAYFLAEVGSNCLCYSEFKIPFKFCLWFGAKGFVVGVEQKGSGFNALKVDQQRLKDGEGAAFEFFRNCRSEIFFDDKVNAKMVLMEWKV